MSASGLPRVKSALVTGGTRGIGLASALALGRHGVRCALTYHWGSADEADLFARFEEAGAPRPLLLQADTSSLEDTEALAERVVSEQGGVDALIVNAGGAVMVGGPQNYQRRALEKSLRYSAWPLADYLLQLHARSGRYPRYVVAMSSTGPDTFTLGYDFMAAAKAALEVLCRYLSWHLREEDVRINVVRSRAVRTETFDRAFGREFAAFVEEVAPHKDLHWVRPEDVADVVVALCSGLLDGVRGQVLTVDRGGGFADSALDLYQAGEDPTYQRGGGQP